MWVVFVFAPILPCEDLHFCNNKARRCQKSPSLDVVADVMNMPLKFWNKNQIPVQGDSNLTRGEILHVDC